VLKKHGWRFQKGRDLVAFVYLPPEVEKLNSHMKQGIDYATSELGVAELAHRKTTEAAALSVASSSSSSSSTSLEAQNKQRFKPSELFANCLFLLTSLKDEVRVEVTTQVSKHGGRVLPTVRSVENAMQKAKSSSSGIELVVFILSEANVSAHRRAKYQYCLALGIAPLHYSWAIDCIRNKSIANPMNPYRLPIGVNVTTGRVEFPSHANDLSQTPAIFEGLNVIILLSQSEVSEWKCVLHTAGANVVSCPAKSFTSEMLIKKDVNLLIAKSNDLLSSRPMRQAACALGIPVASFDWVMQCLMQKERLELEMHISYTVSARISKERIWVKRGRKEGFENAEVLTSDSGKYKVKYQDGGYSVVTEEQVLHPDEPTRPPHIGALFVGASHVTDAALRSGTDLDYASVSLHRKNFNLGDTCVMTDGRVGTIERLFAREDQMRMRWRLLQKSNSDHEVGATDEIVECGVNRISERKVLLLDQDAYEQVNWSSTSETQQQKIMSYCIARSDF
jgi:hypothetical protein